MAVRREEHAEYLSESIMNDPNNYRYYPAFSLVLGIKGANLLSWLIHRQEQTNPDDESAWFECTINDVYKAIRYTARSQGIQMRKMKAAGFISTSRAGMPATRRIQIHHEVINRTLGEFLAKSGGSKFLFDENESDE